MVETVQRIGEVASNASLETVVEGKTKRGPKGCWRYPVVLGWKREGLTGCTRWGSYGTSVLRTPAFQPIR